MPQRVNSRLIHARSPLGSRRDLALPPRPHLAPDHHRRAKDSETYGDQEGSACNGHFECECYHPLFCFNQFGDVERALLRDGNVAIADLYEALEAEGYLYAIRLKGNEVLYREIEHLLTRPVGRPPNKPQRFYHSFEYQAKSWGHPRRVVAKVEWHRGELFPRVGFIVTNLRRSARRVVTFYNGRGAAEQWIKEGKNAVR